MSTITDEFKNAGLQMGIGIAKGFDAVCAPIFQSESEYKLPIIAAVVGVILASVFASGVITFDAVSRWGGAACFADLFIGGSALYALSIYLKNHGKSTNEVLSIISSLGVAILLGEFALSADTPQVTLGLAAGATLLGCAALSSAWQVKTHRSFFIGLALFLLLGETAYLGGSAFGLSNEHAVLLTALGGASLLIGSLHAWERGRHAG